MRNTPRQRATSWHLWSLTLTATAALALCLPAPARGEPDEGKGDKNVKEARDGPREKGKDAGDAKHEKGKGDDAKHEKAARDGDEGKSARDRDDEPRERKGDKPDRKPGGEEHELPGPVRKTAERHAPGLKVESVKTKEVGDVTVYIIEGDSQQRDVWLTIEEDGDILDARFRPHPEGEKPKKQAAPQEELPEKVKQTVNRVAPGLTIEDVKVRDQKGEGKIYQVDGGWTQDRHVLMFVEEDGDLRTVQVARARGAPKPGERPHKDPNQD